MKRLNLYVACALFILCVLSYSNAFRSQFLMDDFDFLAGETSLRHVTWGSLWTQGFQGHQYRPIGFAFLKLFVHLFQDQPAYYIGLNFLMFYGICLLFWFILSSLPVLPSFLSAVAVLLYSVHPINNFLVNFKTNSILSLYVICLQLSVLFFLKFDFGQKKHNYFLAFLFFILGLGVHEVSVMLPAYLFIILYFFQGRSPGNSIKKVIPFFILSGIYVWLYVLKVFLPWPEAQSVWILKYPLGNHLAAFAQGVIWYGAKLLFPSNVLFLWDIPLDGIDTRFWIFLFVAMAGWMVWLIIFFKKRNPVIAGSTALFLLGLLPSFPASMTYSRALGTAIMEPHWFQFSSIGFFMLAGVLFYKIQWGSFRYAGLTFIAIILGLLIISTRDHNRNWVDETTYCKFWLKNNPYNGLPWICLENVYVNNTTSPGQKEELLKIFNQAWVGGHYIALSQAGGVYCFINKYHEAIHVFSQVLDQKPDHHRALLLRAASYYQIGQKDPADKDLEKYIGLRDADGEIICQLGSFFVENRDVPRAVSFFKKAKAIGASCF